MAVKYGLSAGDRYIVYAHPEISILMSFKVVCRIRTDPWDYESSLHGGTL